MSPATGFAVPPTRILASAMWLVGLAGCYNSSALPEGAPCQRTEQCPESQQCVLGSCLRSAPPPVDARPPPPPDAMIDAMVDAMPVACVLDGLTCGSGTPLTFQCGSHCWAKCTDMVSRATAETRCTAWSGVPGEIADATENSCVNQHIVSIALWIGATQGGGAATPADKWTWNGDATKLFNNYTNWGSGRPDDAGDGVENGQEQCATIRPGGTWDDDSCNQPLAFFCTRALFR
jgi:hypothetical protein